MPPASRTPEACVFGSTHAGTAAKPAPMAFKLSVKTTTPASTRPPVQLDIKVKIYGLKLDGKDFPTCSLTADRQRS